MGRRGLESIEAAVSRNQAVLAEGRTQVAVGQLLLAGGVLLSVLLVDNKWAAPSLALVDNATTILALTFCAVVAVVVLNSSLRQLCAHLRRSRHLGEKRPEAYVGP